MKALVVEDDQRMASLLIQGLTEEGHVVVAAQTGTEGYSIAQPRRSARDTKEDMIQGLDLSADDCLTKTFDFEVFCVRVRAAIRRGPATMEVVLRAGPLEVNTSSRRVKVLGRAVTLSTDRSMRFRNCSCGEGGRWFLERPFSRKYGVGIETWRATFLTRS